jgi:hypothetical protein
MNNQFQKWRIFSTIFLFFLLVQTTRAQFQEFSGNIKIDYRYFPESGLYQGQRDHYLSMALEPNYYIEWNDGYQNLVFTGFARYDQYDNNRSHFDIRELYWQLVKEDWELSVGLKIIYWGVTESVHLVDVINQTDFVESFDGEQKLGQPMVHFSYPADWGVLDLFLLPYFRQRIFSAGDGRLRPPFKIDTNNPEYESKAENRRLDAAVRWSYSVDIFDLGLSHFYGTNREMVFLTSNISDNTIKPFYEIVHQSGIDLQATADAMLWKFELIRRQSERQTMTALAAGIEYTFSNIYNSGTDIGFLTEYLFDDRGNQSITGLEDDIFIGSRIALNDVQSSEFLLGGIIDRKNGSILFSIEGSRRFGDSWKANLELRAFRNIAEQEFLYFIRKDSFFQLTIAKYF